MEKRKIKKVLFSREPLDHKYPAIFISALCGNFYTPKNYRREAAKLERWGFVRMRSRRDKTDGRVWEFWYLPGLWTAKQELRDAIIIGNGKKEPSVSMQVKRVTDFLVENSIFGSLDIVVQRLAMMNEPE